MCLGQASKFPCLGHVFETWHWGCGDKGARIPTNRFIERSGGQTGCVPKGFKPQGHCRGKGGGSVRGGVVECGGEGRIGET